MNETSSKPLRMLFHHSAKRLALRSSPSYNVSVPIGSRSHRLVEAWSSLKPHSAKPTPRRLSLKPICGVGRFAAAFFCTESVVPGSDIKSVTVQGEMS